MNARDPLLPVQPDEASAIAEFAGRVWDEEIVPALTNYIAIPKGYRQDHLLNRKRCDKTIGV